MASPAKKTKTSVLPICPYGARCYRKNPEHLKEFSHSTKVDDSNSKDSKDDTDGAKLRKIASKPNLNDASLPPCKYGASCYRKNLLHFAEYSHPTSVVKQVADSGSDTDPIETDEEEQVYQLIVVLTLCLYSLPNLLLPAQT